MVSKQTIIYLSIFTLLEETGWRTSQQGVFFALMLNLCTVSLTTANYMRAASLRMSNNCFFPPGRGRPIMIIHGPHSGWVALRELCHSI
jgi:hypothetical protein